MRFRVGLGHDTHRLGADRPLVIGGVTIEHPIGLVGHSDADVLLHAVTDAILGAMGRGDIGEWFPDTDARFHNADSAILLAEVVAAMREAGYRVENLDAVIFAERPKLSAYKVAISQRVASLIGCDVSSVNIKAKTGEKVGPIGRQEAIAAEVVVLLAAERSSII